LSAGELQPEDVVSEFAHELRTPIAVIAGFAELLGARDDERTRLEAATQIGRAAARLSDVVDDLVAALERDPDLAAALAAARGGAR
jgi:signal transduction histidine kinase